MTFEQLFVFCKKKNTRGHELRSVFSNVPDKVSYVWSFTLKSCWQLSEISCASFLQFHLYFFSHQHQCWTLHNCSYVICRKRSSLRSQTFRSFRYIDDIYISWHKSILGNVSKWFFNFPRCLMYYGSMTKSFLWVSACISGWYGKKFDSSCLRQALIIPVLPGCPLIWTSCNTCGCQMSSSTTSSHSLLSIVLKSWRGSGSWRKTTFSTIRYTIKDNNIKL